MSFPHDSSFSSQRSVADDHPTGSRRWSTRVNSAFTLVELLVVMAIIIALLAATGPLIRGIMSGRNVSDGVDAVADYLKYARMQATTQNTYTVVGFYQAKSSDSLQIGSVVSVNGTFDPSQFVASPPVFNATYPSLGKIVLVPNVTFVSEPNLSSQLKSRLYDAKIEAGISDGTILDCLSATPNNASIFSFLSGRTTFGKAAANPNFPACIIVFSPQGEALYFPQAAFANYTGQPIAAFSSLPFYGQLFIGLRATRNGAVIANDVNSAAITLDGGSGDIKVYRL